MNDPDENEQPWICARSTFELAKHLIDRRGGTNQPIGEKIIQLAAAGKVTAACRELSRTIKIPEEELALYDEMKALMGDDSFSEWLLDYRRKKRELFKADAPEFRLVPTEFWEAMANRPVDGKVISCSNGDWHYGHFSFVATLNPIEPNSPFYHAMSDPGFDLNAARHVYFCEEDILSVSQHFDSVEPSSADFSKARMLDFSPFLRRYNGLAGEPNTVKLPPAKVNIGGRRSAQHGEPIAVVTLRVSSLSVDQLNRYTADALSLELAEDVDRRAKRTPLAG